MGVSHQLVVREDADPVRFVLLLLLDVTTLCPGETLDLNGVRVEVLHHDVPEEGRLVLFVNGNLDVGLARLLALNIELVSNHAVHGREGEGLLLNVGHLVFDQHFSCGFLESLRKLLHYEI